MDLQEILNQAKNLQTSAMRTHVEFVKCKIQIRKEDVTFAKEVNGSMELKMKSGETIKLEGIAFTEYHMTWNK